MCGSDSLIGYSPACDMLRILSGCSGIHRSDMQHNPHFHGRLSMEILTSDDQTILRSLPLDGRLGMRCFHNNSLRHPGADPLFPDWYDMLYK